MDVTKEKTENRKNVSMDTILIEDLGEFGFYQIRILLLFSLAVLFISWSVTEYIFTAARIPTRCLIPECESSYPTEFLPEWLGNAVPSDEGSFDNCRRFASNNNTFEELADTCPADYFDQQNLIECEEHVYQSTNTVVYSYGLACDEWRRSLVGTVQSLGQFCALFAVGFVSDRWGRRATIIVTSINSAWIGVLRYFADTYNGFIISNFAQAAFGSGGFSSAYIIMNESCGPNYRIAGSALMSSCFSIGQAALALLAWGVPNWKSLTLAIYIPHFIALTYFWIMPESARWYLSKQRYEEADKILREMARINRRQISEQTLEDLKTNLEEERRKEADDKLKESDEPWLVVLVFRNKAMLLRCCVICACWMVMTFVYYGLTINAVNISGNPYLNFMAVSLIEIPGYGLGYLMLYNTGRKQTIITGYWACAACQFAYLFMPDNLPGLSLTLYLIGKCAISVLVLSLYVYTTELYPTKYRHRLFAFSSMMGRIGSIVAPLTPAFGDDLPFILFGSLALAAGLLIFLTPETRGTKLPESMQEAIDTGKKDTD